MKKGQAALEFLMTYGWAILVVLAAIAALAYFGILNPSKFTPDTCIGSSGIGCLGKPVITNDSVTVSFGSGLGYDVDINPNDITSSTPLSCTTAQLCDLGGTANCVAAGNSKTLADGQGLTLKLTDCTFSANANIVKGEVTMTYQNPQSKLSEKITLGISGKITS